MEKAGSTSMPSSTRRPAASPASPASPSSTRRKYTGSKKPVTLLEVLGIDGCVQSICGSSKEGTARLADEKRAGVCGPGRDKAGSRSNEKAGVSAGSALEAGPRAVGRERPRPRSLSPHLRDAEEELRVGEEIWTPLGGWSAGPHQPASAPPTEAALAMKQIKELTKASSARWSAADNTPAGSAEMQCLETLAEYWHHAEAFVPDDEEKRWAGLGAEVAATERKRRARIAQWQAETGLRIADSGGRVGLLNLRNTCWMNSVLQILAHLGPFTALMLSMREEDKVTSAITALDLPMKRQPSCSSEDSVSAKRRISCPEVRSEAADKHQIACRVKELLQTLWQDQNSSAVSPSRLHVALMRLAPSFIRRGMREDAHEFFAFLLQQMHEELEDKSNPQPKGGEEMPEMIDLRAWVTCLTSSRSPIHSLFQGRQLSIVTCTQCGYFSARPEDFLHISIPIKSDTLDALAKPVIFDKNVPPNIRKKERRRTNFFGRIQLQDAMAAVTAEELLNGDNCWECERCKKKVEATKKVKLDMMPPVLVIHLLRFSYDPQADAVVKMRGQVELPENWPEAGIDLSRHCTKADHTCLYDVLGVVNHHGPDTNNGHYTACCKHDVDGSWYLFNDGQVESVEPLAAYQPEHAYVLVLGRRHCKAPIIRSNPQGDMRSWASSGFESFGETDDSDDEAFETGGPSATEHECDTPSVQERDEHRDRELKGSMAERGANTSVIEANAPEPTATATRPEAVRPPPGARRMENSGSCQLPRGARRTETA